MANKIIENHVARRLYPVEPDPVCANKGDIVNYVRKNKVTKVGDGEDDYIMDEVVVEESRVNRQAYIEEQCSDIGIMAILEKVRRSGDITLFNQIHAVIPEGIQDYTQTPSNIGDALQVLKTGGAAFDGLKAIFGNRSFEDIANMSEAEYNKVLLDYVASISPKTGEEGVNK